METGEPSLTGKWSSQWRGRVVLTPPPTVVMWVVFLAAFVYSFSTRCLKAVKLLSNSDVYFASGWGAIYCNQCVFVSPLAYLKNHFETCPVWVLGL